MAQNQEGVKGIGFVIANISQVQVLGMSSDSQKGDPIHMVRFGPFSFSVVRTTAGKGF